MKEKSGAAKTIQRHAQRGFTLLEAMVLMVVLSIVAVGVGVGLQSISRVPTANNLRLAVNSALISKMEELRATTFTALTVGTSLSDTVTLGNTTYTRNVTIATADANSDGTLDSDYKVVTVTVNGQSLTMWVTQP